MTVEGGWDSYAPNEKPSTVIGNWDYKLTVFLDEMKSLNQRTEIIGKAGVYNLISPHKDWNADVIAAKSFVNITKRGLALQFESAIMEPYEDMLELRNPTPQPTELTQCQYPRDGHLYNIIVDDGVLGSKYLCSPASGRWVQLWYADVNNGREQWRLTERDNFWWLINERGVTGEWDSHRRRYLSVSDETGNYGDLLPFDDGSGRQRWIISDAPGDGPFCHISIAGGVTSDGVLLNVIPDGSKVNLSNVDDGSGRQRWRFVEIEYNSVGAHADNVELDESTPLLGERRPSKQATMKPTEKPIKKPSKKHNKKMMTKPILKPTRKPTPRLTTTEAGSTTTSSTGSMVMGSFDPNDIRNVEEPMNGNWSHWYQLHYYDLVVICLSILVVFCTVNLCLTRQQRERTPYGVVSHFDTESECDVEAMPMVQ